MKARKGPLRAWKIHLPGLSLSFVPSILLLPSLKRPPPWVQFVRRVAVAVTSFTTAHYCNLEVVSLPGRFSPVVAPLSVVCEGAECEEKKRVK